MTIFEKVSANLATAEHYAKIARKGMIDAMQDENNTIEHCVGLWGKDAEKWDEIKRQWRCVCDGLVGRKEETNDDLARFVIKDFRDSLTRALVWHAEHPSAASHQKTVALCHVISAMEHI